MNSTTVGLDLAKNVLKKMAFGNGCHFLVCLGLYESGKNAKFIEALQIVTAKKRPAI